MGLYDIYFWTVVLGGIALFSYYMFRRPRTKEEEHIAAGIPPDVVYGNRINR